MYIATLYTDNQLIKHQEFSRNLQRVTDAMENYCTLTPQEAKVLLLTRLLHCAAGKIVIIEQNP